MLTPEVKDELGHLWSLLWPIALTNGLLMALQIEDQVILGRIGVDELAAAALGTTVFNLAWFFLAGAASAVDTLVAQAFGARDYEACEYWTRMGYLLMTVLSIPAMVIFQWGEWVVRVVFRQEAHLAHMAGRYTQLLLPGLWPFCMFIVMQKSMQARNVLMPSLYIMVLANVLNIGGNYLYIYGLGMGFEGSPLATSTSRILTALLTAGYYYCVMSKRQTHGHLVQGHSYNQDLKGDEPVDILAGDHGEDGHGDALRQPLLPGSPATPTDASASASSSSFPDTLAFRQAFWRFLALAIPGGFMLGLEAWSFDWTVTFAAQFGTEALDAHQSMMSISAFTYLTVPLAISIAASIRVGNLLGAQRPQQAKVAAGVCLVIGMVVMLFCGLVLLAFRHSLGKIFTPDAKVVDIVAKLCPIMVGGVGGLDGVSFMYSFIQSFIHPPTHTHAHSKQNIKKQAIYQVFDGAQGVSAGVLRGMGRQTRVALLNFGGFWVLGLPMGFLLAFHFHVGVYGVWWGFCIGLFVISLLYLWALSRIDFEEEARRALLAVTDQKLEHAWEETVEHEKQEQEAAVVARAQDEEDQRRRDVV